jgi:hypothetical protein
MKSLIVTNKHNNIGKVIDVDFCDRSQHLIGEDENHYHFNDVCDVETLEHEHEKAIKLANYWLDVAKTIEKYWKGYGGIDA